MPVTGLYGFSIPHLLLGYKENPNDFRNYCRRNSIEPTLSRRSSLFTCQFCLDFLYLRYLKKIV